LKGQEKVYVSPLIFQNIRLPELAPSVGYAELGLPRLRRAGPSTSLDKSAVRGYSVVVGDNTMSAGRCQSILIMLPSIIAFVAKHLYMFQEDREVKCRNPTLCPRISSANYKRIHTIT
jgi:hypothetical protein